MSGGVIDLFGFAGSVIFAIPVAFFGLLKFMEGEALVGVGFLLLAGVMVVGMEIYTSPTDVAGGLAKRVAGKVAKKPEDEE